MAHPEEIIVGNRFKHFKGNLYKILGVATLEEDSDTLVLYTEYDPGSTLVKRTWARRMDAFCAMVPDPSIPSGELKDLADRPLTERFKLWSGATGEKLGFCEYRTLLGKESMCLFMSHPRIQRYVACSHTGEANGCDHYKRIQAGIKELASTIPPLPEMQGFSIETKMYCEECNMTPENMAKCTNKICKVP